MPLILLLGSLLILGALGLSFPSPDAFLSQAEDEVAAVAPTAPRSGAVTWRENYGTAITLPARMRVFDPCQRTDGPWVDLNMDAQPDNLLDMQADFAGHPGFNVGSDFTDQHERRASSRDCDSLR